MQGKVQVLVLLSSACDLQAMVGAWERGCGRMSEYAMQYTRTFANLCNAGVPVASLADVATRTCTSAVQ